VLERSHVQSTGFRNVGPVGARTGFEVRIRQPNYRGTRLSLIEGVDLTIDGIEYAAETSRIRVGDREYSHAEMAAATEVRFQVGTYLTVIVAKPGGLTPGVHQIASSIRYRHPYFPPAFQPVFVRDQRHATIVVP
jgi:Domain of unknown function (DUF6379)